MKCHPRRLAVNCHPPGDPRQAVEIRSQFPESDREFAGGGTVQHMFAGDARGAPLAPKARSWLSRIPLAKVKPPKRTSDSHYRWLSRAFNIFIERPSIFNTFFEMSPIGERNELAPLEKRTPDVKYRN